MTDVQPPGPTAHIDSTGGRNQRFGHESKGVLAEHHVLRIRGGSCTNAGNRRPVEVGRTGIDVDVLERSCPDDRRGDNRRVGRADTTTNCLRWTSFAFVTGFTSYTPAIVITSPALERHRRCGDRLPVSGFSLEACRVEVVIEALTVPARSEPVVWVGTFLRHVGYQRYRSCRERRRGMHHGLHPLMYSAVCDPACPGSSQPGWRIDERPSCGTA